MFLVFLFFLNYGYFLFVCFLEKKKDIELGWKRGEDYLVVG